MDELRARLADAVAVQVLRVETADKSPVDLAASGPRFVEALEKTALGRDRE